MKRLFACVCVLLCSTLCSCTDKPEKEPGAYGEYLESLESKGAIHYYRENADKLADEQMVARATDIAQDASLDIEARCDAVLLLCSHDYIRANDPLGENEIQDYVSVHEVEYPLSSKYAADILNELDWDNEMTWEYLNSRGMLQLEQENSVSILFGAGFNNISSESLERFYTNMDSLDYNAEKRINAVLREAFAYYPEQFYTHFDNLLAEGIWEGWAFPHDYQTSLLEQIPNHLQTFEEKFSYVKFLRKSILPANKHHWESEDFGIPFFETDLRIPIAEQELTELTSSLQQNSGQTSAPPVGSILAVTNLANQSEGVNCYIDASFMLSLPEEQFPTSLEEIDYLLYVYGMYSGNHPYYISKYNSGSKFSASAKSPTTADFTGLELDAVIILYTMQNGEPALTLSEYHNDPPLMIDFGFKDVPDVTHIYAAPPNFPRLWRELESGFAEEEQ